MAKKNRLPFDKRGGVVAMPRRLLQSPDYLNLSPQAKVLMQLLQMHWKADTPIGYGVREAQRCIPCSRHTAIRSFKELEKAKFIVMVDNSLFCSRAQSKTRTWRLTWMPWNHKFPTNDWEKKAAS